MINILEKVSNKNDLCYISSKTKYSLELSYAIKYNEKFLMGADTCDYEYDWYFIIKWENIEDIEYNNRAILESIIIKNENRIKNSGIVLRWGVERKSLRSVLYFLGSVEE